MHSPIRAILSSAVGVAIAFGAIGTMSDDMFEIGVALLAVSALTISAVFFIDVIVPDAEDDL